MRKVGNVTIFNLQGDFVFNSLVDIRATVKGEIGRSSTEKFLVELDGVEMIDSAGIGFIVSVYKAVISRQGAFALVCSNGVVNNVIAISGLTRLFKIYGRKEDAIVAFSEP